VAKLKSIVETFKRELKIYQLVLKDPRTPKASKWLLGLAIAYILSPIDLIPDFIPVIGYLDDLLLVPLLVWLAVRMIPKEIMIDCRARVSSQ